jgi:hypothetical protein
MYERIQTSAIYYSFMHLSGIIYHPILCCLTVPQFYSSFSGLHFSGRTRLSRPDWINGRHLQPQFGEETFTILVMKTVLLRR